MACYTGLNSEAIHASEKPPADTRNSTQRKAPWRLMTKHTFLRMYIKAYIGLSLILLAVIFIAQNATVVEIQLLF
jgi:uncharacterized integral membrane protein